MKEEEKKDLLLEYFKWLDQSGMLDKTLCYDPEHQINTFIELRERKRLPETWVEFCETYPITPYECYINNRSILDGYGYKLERDWEHDRNLLPDRETAEAVLALCQLIQLRDCYNQGWVPNWEEPTSVFFIVFDGRVLTIDETYHYPASPLYFKTEELRDMFLNNFSELIEKLKPLYGIKKGGSDE